jgi:VWFA-related protein
MKIFSSFLFWAMYSAAQQPASPQSTPPQAYPADPNAVIRVETNVVLVDAVVTDKKGNYVRDLKQKDFKVYEDGKEQSIKSFSFEADPASPLNSQPRYLVLMFDNSTMNFGDQAIARKAAASFIDSNAGPNRLMAIANFSGGLQITQNFTSDVARLKAVVSGTSIAMGPTANDSRPGGLGRAAGNFGARNMILAIRDLARDLKTIPGRKTLVLLTAGFRVTPELLSDATATIDMCNRSNVAIYPIDVRGLVAPAAWLQIPDAPAVDANASPFKNVVYQVAGRGGTTGGGSTGGSTGGGSTGGSTGGGRGAPGSTGGGSTGGTGRGSTGSSGNTGTSGRSGSGGGGPNVNATPTRPTTASRALVPRIPDSALNNQEIMYMLADGTGGFVIVNTNDLLGGMEKIAKEMNEFYLIGYTPPGAEDGREVCHTIHVKVDKGGDNVRARTGYCTAKLKDVLAQTQTEKTLENRAAAPQAGNVAATMQAPYFFTGANVARVNVAMELPASSIKFDKEKGKLRSSLNVLGVAYKKDGSVGARFSDTVKIEYENQKEVEEFQGKVYHYENQFDVASGEYNLKVVFSAGGENFGKVEQPLVVDPYDIKKFNISALALSTHFQKVSDSDPRLETALLEDRTPLIAEGFHVIPAGSAKFKKTDKAAMYFEIYEPGLVDAQPPKDLAVGLQIRVFDAKGAAKSDSGGFRIPVPEKGGNPQIPFAAQIPVATLDPGLYKVEVSAVDSLKNTFVRTAIFEVQ